MLNTIEQIAPARPGKITSTEALESLVNTAIQHKINRTRSVAAKEAEIARVEKRFENEIALIDDEIATIEARILEYCESNRGELFPAKKSRETGLAEYGFEITPPRVETASRRIRWKDVIANLKRFAWGKKYLNYGEPKVNKEALLADRQRLTEGQKTSAGIAFCQDEQFFIRPKPETAK